MCVLVNEGNHNVACSQRGQPATLDSRQRSWVFIIRLLSVGRPTVYQVTDPRVVWNKVVFHWYQKVLVLHQLGIHLSMNTPEKREPQTVFLLAPFASTTISLCCSNLPVRSKRSTSTSPRADIGVSTPPSWPNFGSLSKSRRMESEVSTQVTVKT